MNSVRSGDLSRYSPQSYVKAVAVGLPLCKSQGWSLSDRGQTLPEDHWAWSTSAGRTSLSLIHNHNISLSEEPTVLIEKQNESDLPLSRLRLQGSSKLLLILGQPAWVFQLLTKPAAVASGTPLSFRKSSAWLLLKFPHRPAGRHHHVNVNTKAFI